MNPILDLLAQSPATWLIFIFILSLMVGSFLNVVIYRLPIMLENSWKAEYQSYFNPEKCQPEQSRFDLIKPDSTCPHCQHQIRAWENIPVLSWIWLKGKCSQCDQSISIRYPLVELTTGLLSAWVAWHFGFGLAGFAAVALTWCLVALTCIDFDTMLLPDQITLPLLWAGLLLNINHTFTDPVSAIIGAATGYLVLWSIYWVFKLLTGKEGMGYGDFKLLAALGAWFGWQQLPMIVLLSSLVGAVVGIALLSIQGKGKSTPIPFGPYLAIAGWLAMLYGSWIADQYWQMIGL